MHVRRRCEQTRHGYLLLVGRFQQVGGAACPWRGRVLRPLYRIFSVPSACCGVQVGCMGYNARPGPIALTIEAFRDGLKQQGRL